MEGWKQQDAERQGEFRRRSREGRGWVPGPGSRPLRAPHPRHRVFLRHLPHPARYLGPGPGSGPAGPPQARLSLGSQPRQQLPHQHCGQHLRVRAQRHVVMAKVALVLPVEPYGLQEGMRGGSLAPLQDCATKPDATLQGKPPRTLCLPCGCRETEMPSEGVLQEQGKVHWHFQEGVRLFLCVVSRGVWAESVQQVEIFTLGSQDCVPCQGRGAQRTAPIFIFLPMAEPLQVAIPTQDTEDRLPLGRVAPQLDQGSSVLTDSGKLFAVQQLASSQLLGD